MSKKENEKLIAHKNKYGCCHSQHHTAGMNLQTSTVIQGRKGLIEATDQEEVP